MTSGHKDSITLSNARLVLPDRIVVGALVVEAGRVVKVIEGHSDPSLDGSKIDLQGVDLQGLTLLPGFIDVHLHGAIGVDALSATPAELLRVSEFLLRKGVTAWLPTLVPAAEAEYRNAVASIAEAIKEQEVKANGARILGLHYEGPFVSSAQCGALHGAHFRKFSSSADLESLPTLETPDAIHLMTLAPEVEGGLELIREIAKRGWVASLGHTRAEVSVLEQAFAAGARHMTHFMNAMPPLHHRNPGPVGWGLARADVSCDVIADGVHLDPFMLRLLVQVKSPRQLMLISDAIAAAGAGDGDYQIWGETISVVNGRTSNIHGSIAGSVITMLDAVRMMLALGVSEIDVAQMAAGNPARLLRIDRECGSIEEGKRADLVALDAGGNVRFTMVRGKGLWT
jgi:N-acetylglucosamine-6-phosphate deacetylase